MTRLAALAVAPMLAACAGPGEAPRAVAVASTASRATVAAAPTLQGRSPTSACKLVRGTRDWERVAIELTVPADATVVEVGATVEGPGKACFDDVRLERVSP